MKFKFFDSHCHPQLSAFDADREEVLARMREHEVGGLVVGTDLEESRKAIELAESHDFLWAAVGLHPNDNPHQEFDDAAFAELAREPKVVAIGECGLDFYRGDRDVVEVLQRMRFQRHIDLALAVHKPLIIHCRPTKGTENSHEEMIAILSAYSGKFKTGELSAVIHFFTSTPEIARRYVELGCYISFPGPITYTDMYDGVVRAVPLERILVETDSPFAAPVPFRGRRNEPTYVIENISRITALRNLSFNIVADQILLNSQRIFTINKVPEAL